MKKYFNKIPAIIFFFVLATYSPSFSWFSKNKEKPIALRILIANIKGNLRISAPGGINIKDLKDSLILSISNEKNILIKRKKQKLIINKKRCRLPLAIIISSKNSMAPLSINEKRYRGSLEVKLKKNNFIQLINIIDLEDYLCGVVPKEFKSRYPAVVKAQAIVARTFALGHRGRCKHLGYDFNSSSKYQVYGGFDCEDPLCNDAVHKTKGLVLTYKGKLAKYPLYHSTCGGQTTSNQDAFSATPIDYLQGVRCNKNPKLNKKKFFKNNSRDFCNISPKYRWEVNWTYKDMLKNIKNFTNNHKIKKIYNIKIIKRDISHRVCNLEVKTNEGNFIIKGSKIRRLLRTKKSFLYSTRFILQKKGRGKRTRWICKGSGWGHGVGMCQFGALGMAKKGYNFKEILKKYYKNIKIEHYKNK